MSKNGKRAPRRIPSVLTEDEQARLLAQVDNQNPSSARALAILRVFLDCGLRASELINLEVKNIDWKSGQMKVRGKGDRDRVLWFNGHTHTALQAWFAVKPTSSSPLVFTGLDGGSPLCGRWLRKLVPRLATLAGIDKRIHVHTLRHSFATNLLSHTKNLFLVSKALGHANLSTTQIYLHLVDGELESAMKGLNHG